MNKRRSSSLLVPVSTDDGNDPVAPDKIRAGLSKARFELRSLLNAFEDISADYAVSELEFALSFNAEGKFLSVGVGGATSITVRLRPEGDDD